MSDNIEIPYNGPFRQRVRRDQTTQGAPDTNEYLYSPGNEQAPDPGMPRAFLAHYSSFTRRAAYHLRYLHLVPDWWPMAIEASEMHSRFQRPRPGGGLPSQPPPNPSIPQRAGQGATRSPDVDPQVRRFGPLRRSIARRLPTPKIEEV